MNGTNVSKTLSVYVCAFRTNSGYLNMYKHELFVDQYLATIQRRDSIRPILIPGTLPEKGKPRLAMLFKCMLRVTLRSFQFKICSVSL